MSKKRLPTPDDFPKVHSDDYTLRMLNTHMDYHGRKLRGLLENGSTFGIRKIEAYKEDGIKPAGYRALMIAKFAEAGWDAEYHVDSNYHYMKQHLRNDFWCLWPAGTKPKWWEFWKRLTL
jgi:hypothetical protein